MSKKNIAILLPVLYGGGAERVASILSTYLSEKGYQIYIFTKKITVNDYNFSGKIIKLPTFNKDIYMQNKDTQILWQIAHTAYFVKKLKQKYRINASISFMEEFNIINILSKNDDKIIIRICTILSAREEFKGIIYKRWFLKLLYNKADKIIVMSKFGKKDMVNNYKINPQIISIIQNPVISHRKQQKNKEWEWGTNTIVSVARITEVKQQKTLIESFAIIHAALPETRLLLLGEAQGAYVNKIRQLVKKKNLQDVILFLGQVKNVQYYLENSKVFILLSKVEGFPNSIIEAMQEGVPVICSDSPGANREIIAPEIRDRVLEKAELAQYGILLPFINENDENSCRYGVEQCAEAALKILMDEDLRKYYQKKSIDRAKKYSIEIIGAKWMKEL